MKVWSRQTSVRSGILGGGDQVGWLAGWATKGKTLRNGVGEEVVKAESERAPAHARTYQGSIHHRRSIRLVLPTAVKRPSRKEEKERESGCFPS